MPKVLKWTSAYGLAMRVTRLSSLGRVVYGPDSQVVTDGFVSVTTTPQITEGEAVRTTKANGQDCLLIPGKDSLDYLTVSMVFCQVDPALYNLVNEQVTLLRNAFGEVHGYDEDYNIAQLGGFALEMWSEAPDQQPSDPRAEGSWLYTLIPFLQGGVISEEVVDVNAASFTLTGKTKRGNAWGRGPYDVEVVNAVTGEIGPMLTPIGTTKFRRKMLVTVPPPLPSDGTMPVSNPLAPDIVVEEAYGDPERRTVQVLPPVVGGPWRVDWGDGTIASALDDDGATHQYPDTIPTGLPRDYVISVWATATPELPRYERVELPFEGAPAVQKPVLVIDEDTTDPDGMTVELTVNNHARGQVVVAWGDGTEGTNVGDGTTVSSHTYTEDGVKTIVVTDSSDATITASRQVMVPYDGGSALTATVAEASPAGPNRRTARLTWDNQGQGSVTIRWGDNTPVTQGAVSGTADHVYPSAGTYNVVVTDLTTAERSITVPVTVPYS